MTRSSKESCSRPEPSVRIRAIWAWPGRVENILRSLQNISASHLMDRNLYDFAAVADAGVNPAAVRIKTADDHVVDPDERGQHAHCCDQPKRTVPGNSKCESDDVGFARSPVAIKNGGGAFPIHVARPPDVCWDHQ